MSHDLLLDTHVLIWLMDSGRILSSETRQLIKSTCKQHRLLVTAVSVWEIALLHSKGRVSLNKPLQQWLKRIESLPYIKMIALTPEIAIESCELPGEFHGDPADRMIVATARILGVPLITRDQKILAYGQKAYIKAIAC